MGRPAISLIRNQSGEKYCKAGDHWLSVNEFHTSTSAADKLKGMCKNCSNDARILTNFGLTRAKFDAIFKAQGNRCAICKSATPRNSKAGWAVDHDHACCPGVKTCGQCVRGIICHRCNTGLGMFDDNVDSLYNAYNYLEKYNNAME